MVRFDTEVAERIEAFRRASDLPHEASAIRALVQLGLAGGEQLETAWRTAVVEELRKTLYSEMRSKFDAAIAQAINVDPNAEPEP